MQRAIFYFLLIFSISLGYTQTEEEKKELKEKNGLLVKNNNQNQIDFEMNPLAPAKAAFYSAILPGLGQAYNKKYWLIPVIYGGMGASMYAYSTNNSKYNDFVAAYKLELVGKPHEFDNLDVNALERGINGYKKQRDLWLFVTIGIYILNIVEANVDAHLPNRKIDTNLSYQPSFIIDPMTNKMTYGAAVTFNF
jgi:hypothetical protein